MDLLRRYLRLLRIRLAARRSPALGIRDVSVVRDRVWATDIDELRHMNNGVYLSLLDHARTDLMFRSGAWARLRAAGVYPVVAAQTISYRRSLTLGQRFEIHSRIVGYGEKHVYIEQRFVVRGEIWARGVVAGRFLRDRGGVVPLEEVGRIVGEDVAALPADPWLERWSAAVALPSTRAEAPNVWAEAGAAAAPVDQSDAGPYTSTPSGS